MYPDCFVTYVPGPYRRAAQLRRAADSRRAFDPVVVAQATVARRLQLTPGVGQAGRRRNAIMTYWDEWLRDRFADRQVLPRDEAKRQFWADLPSKPVDEFFDFFELEYSAPAGILRPDDDIRRLTHSIRTKSPLRWFLVEPARGDKASELNYQLVNWAKKAGLLAVLPVQTVGDYVRVWCGRAPATCEDHRQVVRNGA